MFLDSSVDEFSPFLIYLKLNLDTALKFLLDVDHWDPSVVCRSPPLRVQRRAKLVRDGWRCYILTLDSQTPSVILYSQHRSWILSPDRSNTLSQTHARARVHAYIHIYEDPYNCASFLLDRNWCASDRFKFGSSSVGIIHVPIRPVQLRTRCGVICDNPNWNTRSFSSIWWINYWARACGEIEVGSSGVFCFFFCQFFWSPLPHTPRLGSCPKRKYCNASSLSAWSVRALSGTAESRKEQNRRGIDERGEVVGKVMVPSSCACYEGGVLVQIEYSVPVWNSHNKPMYVRIMVQSMFSPLPVPPSSDRPLERGREQWQYFFLFSFWISLYFWSSPLNYAGIPQKEGLLLLYCWLSVGDGLIAFWWWWKQWWVSLSFFKKIAIFMSYTWKCRF